MAKKDSLSEHEVWEVLIQYLVDFHDADVNSIAKYTYVDSLHSGSTFYVIDSFDNTERNKAILKCYKNNLNIYGEIIHFIELDKSESFTLNQIIDKLEYNTDSTELTSSAMDELNTLNDDHPLRLLSHAFMFFEYSRSEHLYKLRLNEISIPNSVHDKYRFDQRFLVNYADVRHLHAESPDIYAFVDWLDHSSYEADLINTFKQLIDNNTFNPNRLIPRVIRNNGGLLKPLVDQFGAISSVALFANNTAVTDSILKGAILQSPKYYSGDDAKHLITFDLESAQLLSTAIPLLKTNIYSGYTLENTLKFASKLIAEKLEVALIIPDIYSRPDVRMVNALFDFLYTYKSETFSILTLEHNPPQKYVIHPGNAAFTLYDAFTNFGIDYCLDMFYNAIDASLANKELNLDNLSAFSKHHLHVKEQFNIQMPKTKIEQSQHHHVTSDFDEFHPVSVLNTESLDQATLNWLTKYEDSEELQRLNSMSHNHIELLKNQ